MRVKSVLRVPGSVRCFDLTVAEHHTVALDNGVVVSNCDERCLGNSCGVCNGTDLKLRHEYIAAASLDRSPALQQVRPVDQSTIAVRVRARLSRPEEFRWADNEFRRHLIRRAGYRAQELHGGPFVSKHPIWFASDAHGYRDWTCGTDFVEFGLTRKLQGANGWTFMRTLSSELDPWLELEAWEIFPASVSMRATAGFSLHSLELLEHPDRVRSWISSWQDREYVPLRLKQEGGYFTTTAEEVNAKDFVRGLWLVRSGTGIELRMLARRRAGPYQVWQALSGRAGWMEAARRPARTLGVFAEAEAGTVCTECGQPVPESVMGEVWDQDYCPRCKDTVTGIVL